MSDPSGLIGSDFKGMAGLSPFGRVYRISRLNHLETRHATQLLSIDKNLARDMRLGWFKSQMSEGAPIDSLFGESQVASPYSEVDLIPYRLTKWDLNELRKGRPFRGCLTCLRSGFHSFIHQATWISDCPWHRETLVSQCPCGRSLAASLENARSYLGICSCGYDLYGRFEGLRSLHNWPRDLIEEAIASAAVDAKRERASWELELQADLRADFAIAANVRHRVDGGYLLSTTFGPDDDDASDLLCQSVIKRWSQVRKANHWQHMFILPSDVKRLEVFAATLTETLLRISAQRNKWPFEPRNGLPLSPDFIGVNNAGTVTVASWLLPNNALTFGHRLIQTFCSRAQIPDSPEYDEEKAWTATGSDMKLLARTLSAIAANAVMDCWNKGAWIASADDRIRYTNSRAEVTVLHNRGHLVTRVLTILHLPIVNNPSEEQKVQFRASLGATVLPRRGSHYDLT